MNTLVIYDTKFGNTRMLAEAIGRKLALFGSARVLPVGDVAQNDLRRVDLLVIGGPTQAHGVSPAMRKFIGALDVSPTAQTWTAAFDTRFPMATIITGSAAKGIAGTLVHAGIKLLAPPESFFVTRGEARLKPGELERAVGWAAGLAEQMVAKQRSAA
jgi:flavorubredoxin